MPLKLSELNSMSREQLEALAKEYEISATKKLDNENLAYAIIDKQAVVESQKRLRRSKFCKSRHKRLSRSRLKTSPNLSKMLIKKHLQRPQTIIQHHNLKKEDVSRKAKNSLSSKLLKLLKKKRNPSRNQRIL